MYRMPVGGHCWVSRILRPSSSCLLEQRTWTRGGTRRRLRYLQHGSRLWSANDLNGWSYNEFVVGTSVPGLNATALRGRMYGAVGTERG